MNARAGQRRNTRAGKSAQKFDDTQDFDEEEEFEEDMEEEYEEDKDELSQAAKTRKTRNGKNNTTMKTINKEGKSIIDNTQTTFQEETKERMQMLTSNKTSQSHNQIQMKLGGEEYYDEEEMEEDQTQMNHSRLSDTMMKTPEIRSQISIENNVGAGKQPNVYNDFIKKEQNNYDRVPQPNKPQPINNDDYFKALKQRKSGVPIKPSLPRKIEAQEFNSDLDISTYKEVIPSFLPNDKNYKKFQKFLNQDEDDIQKRLGNKVNSEQDAYLARRKKTPAYSDPFDQHIERMDNKKYAARTESAHDSLNQSLYDIHNMDGTRGSGFKSVQRQRVTINALEEDQHPGNISLPQIRENIGQLEKKMERELDREAKLKKDAKRLIGHALGKQAPELDRTVKAWLKKDNNPGMIEKERVNINSVNPVIDRQLRKINLDKLNDQEQKQKEVDKKIEFNYQEIKQLYNLSLLDQHFGSPEAYLLKKKEDAKLTIQHVFKRKFEEKLVFQEMNDPKTLRKDRKRLEDRLRMINIAVELAKQRLEWLLYDTPYTVVQLEAEIKDTLKNRTGCESISDFVLLFREFVHIERLPDLLVLLNDALLNKKKSQDFYDFLKKIVEFEDETVKIKDEFSDQRMEQNRVETDQFYNYDEIALEKVKLQDKEQFLKQFKQEKIIFQFVPFWYVPLNDENDKLSLQLRQMLKFDIVQAKIVCSFLTCDNMDEMITYARHNRKSKEFVVFEREEINFLSREHKISQNILMEFAQVMLIVQKEFLMIPQMLFKLAKPTKIQEINFSNFASNHLTFDALAAIVACIELHQDKVKRLVFENCEMNPEKAKVFKGLLGNELKSIISCNFDNNTLGDQGLDHIVQAMKNNPKGDMRILRISKNKLSIQAAIRLSHVLKKRPNNLQPLNLQILKMSYNEIGNIGTETLASFIKKNGTLKYLDVSFNQIGDRGLYSLADCLLENEKIEVLNMLGNEFTEKSLASLGNALVENEKIKLIILKLGNLKCDKPGFLNFINNGYMISKKLRYLYLNTPHFQDPITKTLNDSYLPKIYLATESYDQRIDSNVLIDFMSQIVEFQLFEGGNTARVIKYGERLLREIIKQKYEINNIEILIYLFENIFGPEHILRDNLSPFHLFAKHGQIEALSYCLKLSVSPNFKTSIAYEEYPSATALHIASGYSQLDTCIHLLKYGIEVDNRDLNGNTALHYAAVQGALQLSQLLIDNGGSALVLNKKNMLPMHSCIFSDHLGCFKFIIEQTDKQKQIKYFGKQIERTIDVKCYNGLTPLMIALEEESENIFQYLIDQGGDLKAQDEEGNTILHRAILLKNQKKAKLIIKRGANIHIRSFAGETPIMMAVRNGLIEVIRALVQMGADINEKNYRGDTLLHLAAKIDQADVIGYLLDKGLNTLERNREGLRPADLAVRPGIKEMLSHNNGRHNLYTDGTILNKNKAHRPGISLAGTGTDSDEETNARKNNSNNNAKLLNEEMVKYNLDKRDLFGSQYDNKLAAYDAAKISRDRIKMDKDELRDPKIKIEEQSQDDDEENELDEDLEEDGEEYEDDYDELAATKQRTKSDQVRNQKNQQQSQKANNTKNIKPILDQQNTANRSAGFRGTVDVSKQGKNTNNNLVNQTGAKTNSSKPRQNNDAGASKGNTEEDFYNLNEDGEYGEEDGEDFEEEEEMENQTATRSIKKSTARRNSRAKR
ncbi:ankyrin unc44 [Stylonychia lemnae]|uniref:Ankyrin unc44 n=1 Tax=Stylonychia lemnae TaxID=5949 RepID=A0A078ARZ5_STYLE|nr:ankyrin unc44 [Stylonychia lemnae]|eukprot:CDW85255.1 ankyrin unc44 [Stylonychia lemnae]